MFANLSIGHLLVVLVIFLLLFGAKRIPEIAGSMGKGISEFKKTMNAASDDPSAPSQVAARESVPLSAATPSTSSAMTASDDVVREPKRLL
jgi:sec-independent protein translocase protein TatA